MNTIDTIRRWHRRRVFAMDQRKRNDLALGAYMRTNLGWSRNIPVEEAKKINVQAADLIAIGEKIAIDQARPPEKRRGVPEANDPLFDQWRDMIMSAMIARMPWTKIEDEARAQMEQLAQTLPVWEWGEKVAGFGPTSLAVILAETGDLSNYANPGKVWKRMGLAPIEKDGKTRAGSTWRKGGLNAEDWTRAGYSMRRRSYMFVIGDVLIKNKGVYRDVYLERKEFERQKAAMNGLVVAPSAKIPAKRKDEFISDGHIHRMAQRYMEKRFLRDLWVAWRAVESVKSVEDLPATIHASGQRSFETHVSSAGHQQQQANISLNSQQSVPAKPDQKAVETQRLGVGHSSKSAKLALKSKSGVPTKPDQTSSEIQVARVGPNSNGRPTVR